MPFTTRCNYVSHMLAGPASGNIPWEGLGKDSFSREGAGFPQEAGDQNGARSWCKKDSKTEHHSYLCPDRQSLGVAMVQPA